MEQRGPHADHCHHEIHYQEPIPEHTLRINSSTLFSPPQLLHQHPHHQPVPNKSLYSLTHSPRFSASMTISHNSSKDRHGRDGQRGQRIVKFCNIRSHREVGLTPLYIRVGFPPVEAILAHCVWMVVAYWACGCHKLLTRTRRLSASEQQEQWRAMRV